MIKLTAMTNDLTQAARESRIRPAVGREKETFSTLQLLSRKQPKSILVVGDEGVGKTRFVHGLAAAGIRPAKAENILGFTLLELDLPAFLPSGNNAAQSISKLIEFVRNSKNVILFIDDLHLILLPDRGGENASVAASQLIPSIERGEITCVGALATNEFEAVKQVHPDIIQHFDIIRLEPLATESMRKIIDGVCPELEGHHGVTIAPEARTAALELSVRCMPNVHQPGKAIEVLDQACARYKLKLVAKDNYPEMVDTMTLRKIGKRVDVHDVKRVIREMTAIDVDKELAAEWQAKLESRLKKNLPGQEDTATKLAEAVSHIRLLSAESGRRPGTILLWGPDAAAIENVVRILTYQLFGNYDNLLIIDCAQYPTAESTAELFGQQSGTEIVSPLVTAVQSLPWVNLLFQTMEKADPAMGATISQIALTGSLRLAEGRVLGFRRAILLFAVADSSLQSAHTRVSAFLSGASGVSMDGEVSVAGAPI